MNETQTTIKETSLTPIEEKITPRNFWSFSLGAFGRDFSYNFFTGYLLTFILFSKTLDNRQFACVSIIIIVARIFDAFNDPIMGGIIENTHSRWGKFRPWIFVGAILTGIVVTLIFSIPVDGWGFIGFLAVMYLLYSITFTMNDISYWGLLPALARVDHDRNKLMSITTIIGGFGSGLVGFLVPALTTTYSRFLGGSATKAYMWTAIFASVLMIISQTITTLGIRDKSSLELPQEKKSGLSLKDMFRVIKNNDQLLYATLILTLYSVGTGVVTGGLSTIYIYFEFGYNGLLTTIFTIISGLLGFIFTATFPYILKKIKRKVIITFGAITTIVGYTVLMICGLAIPTGEPIAVIMELPIYTKFIVLTLANGIIGIGQTSFYTLMFLNMANTVEYNEWKTGKRDESLIFSLRPFSAKLSSALSQLLVTLVYLSIGIIGITNGISDLDNAATKGLIDNQNMLIQVNALLAEVPDAKKQALIICTCVIPIVFMALALIIFRKKFILDEATHTRMKEEVRLRNINASFDDSISDAVAATSEIIKATAENKAEND